MYPQDWSPDGRFLLYQKSANEPDLWVLPMTGEDRKPRPYLQTEFVELDGRFSPDGRFVAYSSNESGRFEVYVRPFPDAQKGKWMVSKGGGSQPRWRRDGKELFYVSPDSKLMTASVSTRAAFQSGIPAVLFAAPIRSLSPNHTEYDVTVDGKRFLIGARLARPDTANKVPAPISLMLN
jgi:hypothetical protein